jgi:hypothetical protein
MQVAAAHAGGPHGDDNFTWSWFRLGEVPQSSLPVAEENRALHQNVSLTSIPFT